MGQRPWATDPYPVAEIARENPANDPLVTRLFAGIYQRSAQRVVMMAPMRSSDSSDPPSDDFEPAKLMIGPDGGVDQTAQPGPVIRPPPRLCEQGPCVNYHRFAVPFDAEVAKAASIEPGGKMHGQAPTEPVHVEVHHYCYPTPGIEFPLEAPVVQCNRWEPRGPSDNSLVELRRTKFMESSAGKAYTADLAAWEAERRASASRAWSAVEVDSSDGELAAWITMHVRDGDEVEIVHDENGLVGEESVHVHDEVARLTAERAREGLTEGYMDTFGPGSYRVWINRPTNGALERVAFKDIEVL